MQCIKTLCLAAALSLPSLASTRDTVLRSHTSDTIELLHTNHTIEIPHDATRATYMAKVVIVDLARCTNTLSDENFYKGLIVNTFGYRATSKCFDWTSYRVGKDSESTSSTWGVATPSKNDQPYYTWEWLRFPHGKSIRDSGLEIEFRAWNGLPQMYFPLLSPADAKLGGGWAYMIWVKPNAVLMDDFFFYWYYGYCGFNRYSAAVSCSASVAVTNRRMLWTVNIGNLIRDIRADLTLDAWTGYTFHGIDAEASGAQQSSSNSYNDVNQFSLVPTTKGGSGESLCGWKTDATEDKSLLMLKMGKVMSWL